jgi:excisionase family DNA binding protein
MGSGRTAEEDRHDRRASTCQRSARTTVSAAGRKALPTLVGIEEIAEHLGVTVRHVRLLVAQRRIPYLKWGHLLRFDPMRSGCGSTALTWSRGRHGHGGRTRSPAPRPAAPRQ